MGVGDLIHEDNTGRGGSMEFRQQRDRAAAMQQSWTEGAGIGDIPLSPARNARSQALHNLRTGGGGDEG